MTAPSLPRAPLLVAVAAAFLATGCGSPSGPEPPATPDPGEPSEPVLEAVPALGADSTLELGTWNLEWFGATGNGPDDESWQLRTVAWVLAGLEVDLWSLQEVVDPDRFRTLLDSLPGYDGLLADDEAVVDGPAYYRDFGGNEQKVGLVYRTELARVDSARVILTGEDHAFAGRPPVAVHLTLTAGGDAEALVVVLLHAKAGADPEDRLRREAGAVALKEHMDAVWPTHRVVVLGDFNDDVDGSIDEGAPSPYAVFVDDPEGYRFLTASLSEAGESSTVFYPDVVDHHLATDEVAADYLEGSATAVRADAWVPGYGDGTSDHYPVVTLFRLGG